MGYPTTSFGAVLAHSGRGSRSKATSPVDIADARAKRTVAPMPANDSSNQTPPEPVIEGKWAPWKVTTLVLLFCGAFWAAVIWLGFRMFS